MQFLPWTRSRRRHGATYRPRLESMEDRVVLSLGVQSAIGLGGTGTYELAKDVATSTSGNVFVTGEFTGTVDFDPNNSYPDDHDILIGQGTNNDVYVAKYAPTGSLIWVRDIAGYWASPSGIAVDANENVFLTGLFEGTVDFDPTPGTSDLTTSVDRSDAFVARLNADGGFGWAWNNGDPNNDDQGNGIALDEAGSVYTTGDLKRASSNVASFVVKHAGDSPTPVWIKQTQWVSPTSSYIQTSNGIAVRGGSIVVVGQFDGKVDFDPGAGQTTLTGSTSAFVWKLTTGGAFTWVRQFQSSSRTSNSHGTSVAVDGTGGIYTVGDFQDKVDFDPGKGTYTLTSTSGGDRTFASKLDGNGNFVWAVRLPGTGTFSDVAVDGPGSFVYVAGTFSGTADFNPGAGTYNMTSAGDRDAYVVVLAAGAGGFDSAVRMGGPGSEYGNLSLAIDPTTGDIYLAGSFELTASFGSTSLTSNGGRDGFLARLRRTP